MKLFITSLLLVFSTSLYAQTEIQVGTTGGYNQPVVQVGTTGGYDGGMVGGSNGNHYPGGMTGASNGGYPGGMVGGSSGGYVGGGVGGSTGGWVDFSLANCIKDDDGQSISCPDGKYVKSQSTIDSGREIVPFKGNPSNQYVPMNMGPNMAAPFW